MRGNCARGIRCWLDKHELPAGKNWRNFVSSEWPRIALIVVCFGPNGISSGQQHEIENLTPAADTSQSILPIILPDVDPAMNAKEFLPVAL
ncbi:toll/interleukin-1 receptor domain-containing protein [Maribacter sp.]|nr:toll/interleukin-1 receptor domain-containing protein [Maribacter sp.]